MHEFEYTQRKMFVYIVIGSMLDTAVNNNKKMRSPKNNQFEW